MGLPYAVARYYGERRFAVLFTILLIAIAGHAFVGAILPVANPLDWLLGFALLAVVFSAPPGWPRRILGVLATGAVAARLTHSLVAHPAPFVVAQSLFGVACLLASGVSVHRALAAGPVDGERIFAALDAYLLVGMAFGIGYWLLDAALPGAFAVGHGETLTSARAIYFSFVTQATLGYGDIVPLREQAQGLAVVQGVGGQMYLAVLIARLVTLYETPGGKGG